MVYMVYIIITWSDRSDKSQMFGLLLMLSAFSFLASAAGDDDQGFSTWEDYMKQKEAEEECPDTKCSKEKADAKDKAKKNKEL